MWPGLLAAMSSSPGSSSMLSTRKGAAWPDASARAAVPPSRAAIRSSSAAFVGLRLSAQGAPKSSTRKSAAASAKPFGASRALWEASPGAPAWIASVAKPGACSVIFTSATAPVSRSSQQSGNLDFRAAIHHDFESLRACSLCRRVAAHVKLHPDHVWLGREHKRFVDDASGGVRIAKNIDHVDRKGDVLKARVNRRA